MSASLIAANIVRTIPITEIRSETSTVKTFTFKDKLGAKAKPGQFIMLWIPGVDEIPLSILDAKEGEVSVSVRIVGDATKHLHEFKVGQIIGVRGPFGTSFTESRGRVLLVGGGLGAAPLFFLAKRLSTKADKLSFIIGAKTKSDLVFVEKLESICTEESMRITTEDGTYGLRCLATDPIEELVEKNRFNMVYTCGPEKMMRRVFDLAEKHKVAIEASLERLMRCGIGLCGSCVIGKYRVCRDGPVFTGAQLNNIKDEFGISKFGFDGSRVQM